MRQHPTDYDQTTQHFRERGWMRVRQAFDADAAAAMRDVVWNGLARSGIDRNDRATWTVERPQKLQKLKDHPAFQAVGSARLLGVIGEILGTQRFEPPKRWGAAFIAFPSKAPWRVPSRGWHIDAHYQSPLWPPKSVQTFALFGDLPPRSGATQILSGAHRLIHRWFEANPPPAGAHSPEMRKSLQRHPYIADLHRDGDRDRRTQRFMEDVEVVDGVPLQVIEAVGAAGDVILVHPLSLHVAAPNNGAAPRFMLSGGVTTDMAGWAGKL
jgi:phytanoyl-CoA dioxygenase PhyH